MGVVVNFTSDVENFEPMVGKCSADSTSGHGSTVSTSLDPVNCALKVCCDLQWHKNSYKLCILFAPDVECARDRDSVNTARQMLEKGISIFVVGCDPSMDNHKGIFDEIAEVTFGKCIPLSTAESELFKAVIDLVDTESQLESMAIPIVEEKKKKDKQRKKEQDCTQQSLPIRADSSPPLLCKDQKSESQFNFKLNHSRELEYLRLEMDRLKSEYTCTGEPERKSFYLKRAKGHKRALNMCAYKD